MTFYCFGIIDWIIVSSTPATSCSRGYAGLGTDYYVRPRFNTPKRAYHHRLDEQIYELTLPGSPSLVPYTDAWPTDLLNIATSLDRTSL